MITRPTTAIIREAIINILRDRIKDCNWLDLYSGSGVLGCEAIENGANTVVAVELNKKIFKVCKENIENISQSNNKEIFVDVINKEVNKFLKAGYKDYCEKQCNQKWNKEARFNPSLWFEIASSGKANLQRIDNNELTDIIARTIVKDCGYALGYSGEKGVQDFKEYFSYVKSQIEIPAG